MRKVDTTKKIRILDLWVIFIPTTQDCHFSSGSHSPSLVPWCMEASWRVFIKWKATWLKYRGTFLSGVKTDKQKFPMSVKTNHFQDLNTQLVTSFLPFEKLQCDTSLILPSVLDEGLILKTNTHWRQKLFKCMGMWHLKYNKPCKYEVIPVQDSKNKTTSLIKHGH